MRLFTLFTVLFTALTAGAAHVEFNLADFALSGTLTNRTIKLTPLSTPRTGGGRVIVSDYQEHVTGTNESVTVSNVFYGNYKVEVSGPTTLTPFTILVPDTNATLNATGLVVSAISIPPGNVGYSQAAADGKFVARTNGWSTNQTLLHALVDDYLEFNEESTPATPASGKGRIYFKSDGKPYSKGDDGTEYDLTTGGGGGSGEANTGANLGSGWPTFNDKNGVQLRFNTFTSDSTITSSSNNNTITWGRAALTGPVTAPAGGNATFLAADAVQTTNIANGAVTSGKVHSDIALDSELVNFVTRSELDGSNYIAGVSATFGVLASDILYAPATITLTNLSLLGQLNQAAGLTVNNFLSGVLNLLEYGGAGGIGYLDFGNATNDVGGRIRTSNSGAEVEAIQLAPNGGVTIPVSLTVPNGAAPTTDAAGEVALDTTITDHKPLLQYYTGSEEMLVIAIPRAQLTTADGHVVKYSAANDRFQMAADNEGAGGGDSDAIHDNVAGEITAIADKATPVAADHLLIEDSAASDTKKDITIGSLEAALEGFLDLQELQGAVTDAQVPNTITVDLATLATTATTANAGDSATAFFPSGTIEADRLGTGTADDNGFLRGDGAWTRSTTDGQILRLAAGTLGFGALDLADSDAITGTIPDGNLPATMNGKNLTASTATTPATGDNDTSIATTAFVSSTLVASNFQTRAVYREIWIPAGAMTPAGVNGPSTNQYSGADRWVDVFSFDDTTAETNYFTISMPDAWDRGTIKARYHWTASTGTAAQGVTWGIAAAAISDDDVMTTAFGTRFTVTDAYIASGDMHVSAATSAITVGGSPALNDMVLFEVVRVQDVGDTKTGDANLIGVKIQYRESSTDVASW